MITSLKQATAVQKRRAGSGKPGYAKAVRRYLKRKHAGEYKTVKKDLPVFWGVETKAA
ncbi:hypothetical protein [Catenovulum sediminis]|uniref:Uncharacterized protein n=1 Tax=Catenovulum sediminis TaxID=1740262 RepID=A0ABV1RKD2_9ALTE